MTELAWNIYLKNDIRFGPFLDMFLCARRTAYQFYKMISKFLYLIKFSKQGLQINAFTDQSKWAIQNMTWIYKPGSGMSGLIIYFLLFRLLKYSSSSAMTSSCFNGATTNRAAQPAAELEHFNVKYLSWIPFIR